ncbi:MAG: NTP transferase domain-containing protein [Candidatus Eisenbacteria bacterium]|nr:NTP transferase domain-containing protein [Candidatus Eisenbacteria bacterium]
MRAVILAGGKGSRLKPYTTVFPKPLVPVGDQPILELVLRQLKAAGFTDVTLALGHMGQLIQAYCGDGSRWGLKIVYSIEDAPLGTAGPLALAAPPEEFFLAMNGDLLTTLDYGALLRAHMQGGRLATVTVFEKKVPIDLGVLKLDDQGNLLEYIEKPTLTYHVSTGIYAFHRRILDFIPRGRRLDFPDLVRDLIARGESLGTHLFTGQWLDIGRPEDHALAVETLERDPGAFLPPAR